MRKKLNSTNIISFFIFRPSLTLTKYCLSRYFKRFQILQLTTLFLLIIPKFQPIFNTYFPSFSPLLWAFSFRPKVHRWTQWILVMQKIYIWHHIISIRSKVLPLSYLLLKNLNFQSSHSGTTNLTLANPRFCCFHLY